MCSTCRVILYPILNWRGVPYRRRPENFADHHQIQDPATESSTRHQLTLQRADHCQIATARPSAGYCAAMQHSNAGSHLFPAANCGNPRTIGPMAQGTRPPKPRHSGCLCSHQQIGRHHLGAAAPESKLRHERGRCPGPSPHFDRRSPITRSQRRQDPAVCRRGALPADFLWRRQGEAVEEGWGWWWLGFCTSRPPESEPWSISMIHGT
jgi:hypothetical protein